MSLAADQGCFKYFTQCRMKQAVFCMLMNSVLFTVPIDIR